MSVNNPDELLHTVLPPALEVLSAWSIAETEADPTVFHHAMNRAFGDAAGAKDPWRGSPAPTGGGGCQGHGIRRLTGERAGLAQSPVS